MTDYLADEEMQKLQKLHAAHHEAAHAVVGAWFGWRINHEGIEIEGVGEGLRDYTGQRCEIWINTLEAAACINCAGWLAERRLTPDRAKRHSDDDLLFHIDDVRDGEDCFWEADAADDDAQTFARILEEYPDATDDELISHYREFEKQTAALLEKDEIWGTIEKLARALLERGKLSADETRPIMYGEQAINSERIEKIIKAGIQNFNNRQ